MLGIELIYDLVHQDKDYSYESDVIFSLIKQKIPNICFLLDVACGSGNHMFFLQKKEINCTGIDLNKNLCKIAKKKGLNVDCMDMRNFDLNQKFDVITCLFGSIFHVKSVEELRSTFRCFKNHLKEDGLLIIEPWLFINQYHPRTSSRQIATDIIVTSKNSLSGNIAKLEKTYSLKNKSYHTDISICCFSEEEFLSSIVNEGFDFIKTDKKLEFLNGLYLLSHIKN
jgi:SAM-dependent methyltransferase